jgi:hypothetical protein
MYDLNKLMEELPTHPVQLWIKSEHEKKAQQYWENINQQRQNSIPPEPETFVTIVHACHLFSVGDQTIRRWLATGQIATKKEKGRRMVNLRDLQIYHENYIGYRLMKRKER